MKWTWMHHINTGLLKAVKDQKFQGMWGGIRGKVEGGGWGEGAVGGGGGGGRRRRMGWRW